MPFPQTTEVSKLSTEHDFYQANKETWAMIDLLYVGGDQIRKNANRFLDKRPKEMADIYNARIQRFRYQNILASGIDWYLSSIFRTDPEVDYKTEQPDGTLAIIEPPVEVKAFFTRFQNNCDRKGSTFVDFWRDALRSMLLYQSAWILTDLPRPDVMPMTLGEQQQRGLLDGYLVNYSALDVINWSEDDLCNLNWVVVRSVSTEADFLEKPIYVTRWYYYDRQQYAVYESRSGPGGAQQAKSAELVGQGPHALATEQRVPLRRIQVPKGLWIANKVYPQILDHLNTDNVYSWALFIANLAMPVLIGAGVEAPTLSEAGYIRLPSGGDIKWTEPPGSSFQRSEERIAALREEIYRAMYLMAQGRSAQDTSTVQSGYAKQLEMAPASDIQNAFGDVIRASMVQSLNDIALIRQAPVKFDVRGFTFIENPVEIELAEAMSFAGLQVPSDTAYKENMKKAVRSRFPDMNPTTQQSIMTEIDDAPTQQEQMATQQAIEQQQYADKLGATGAKTA